MAMAPTVYPTIPQLPEAVRIIISSGITMAQRHTAIPAQPPVQRVGQGPRRRTRTATVAPDRVRSDLDEINQMDRERFAATFGAFFQGHELGGREGLAAKPFSNVGELRGALQAALFSASPEERLALIRAYPDIGRVFDRETGANPLSVVDQAMAGLDALDTDEHYSLQGLTAAYRQRFGFPLIIAGAGKLQGVDPGAGQPAAAHSRSPSRPPPSSRSRRSPTTACSTGWRSPSPSCAPVSRATPRRLRLPFPRERRTGAEECDEPDGAARGPLARRRRGAGRPHRRVGTVPVEDDDDGRPLSRRRRHRGVRQHPSPLLPVAHPRLGRRLRPFGWLTTLYPVWARLTPEDVDGGGGRGPR
jgi:2-oxo-4-hydroxy-4-carboxy--5-ureidoimidazoline (OHCU) decarboxylase